MRGVFGLPCLQNLIELCGGERCESWRFVALSRGDRENLVDPETCPLCDLLVNQALFPEHRRSFEVELHKHHHPPHKQQAFKISAFEFGAKTCGSFFPKLEKRWKQKSATPGILQIAKAASPATPQQHSPAPLSRGWCGSGGRCVTCEHCEGWCVCARTSPWPYGVHGGVRRAFCERAQVVCVCVFH